MELQTKRLKLRELTAADLPVIHELHAQPGVDEFNTIGIPESLESTGALLAAWLKLQHETPRNSFVFCIVLIDTGVFAGLIALTGGKANFRNAETWYKIHPQFWGNGYATEALHELLRFGFNTLNLHRIEAGCAVDNVASIKVLKKAGMLEEGRKRKNLPIRGRWVDSYFFAILHADHSFGL